MKTNNNQQQQQQQGNVQLPTTPLPPGQVGVGVSVGDPPNIESPPALEVGSLMTSPAGSNVSNTSYQQVKFSAINRVGNTVRFKYLRLPRNDLPRICQRIIKYFWQLKFFLNIQQKYFTNLDKFFMNLQ